MLTTITSDLIRFQTVQGNREEFQKAYTYIESLLPREQFSFEYVEREGVLSQVIFLTGQDWKKARLLLCAHMDVIPAEPEQFEPRAEAGKLFGRGSVDMKSGIAAMVLALKALVEEEAAPSVALLITGDEEVGGDNGAKYICDTFEFSPEFVLVPDGPRVDKMEITNREKGLLWLKLEATGVAAHGSRPWLGVNAIDMLNESIARIKVELDVHNEQGWNTTVSLNRFHSTNTITNKVPDHAEAVLDIRFTEKHALQPEELLQKINVLLSDHARASVLCTAAPVYTPETNVHLQKLQEVVSRVAGEAIAVGYSDASHDACHFAAKGLKTALVGPVGANWHGKNEWVDIRTAELMQQSLKEYMALFV